MNKVFFKVAFFCILFSQLQVIAVSPEEGLEKLFNGNQRYSKDLSTCPDRNQERRIALTSKQQPFAVIVGCSDSRVSPEIVFDQGVGDLFVVRVAGNVVGPIEIDSIEYGVNHLGASVILVLGHENCGAVTAVVEGQAGDIAAVAQMIEPAVKASQNQSGNRIENAIKANVQRVVEQLNNSPKLTGFIKDKKLMIVGGYYSLESGLVTRVP